MTNNKQGGFSVVEVVLVVVVVAALALVGWWVYQMQADKENSQNTAQRSVPEVKNTDDLKEAEEYLSNTDLDKKFDTSGMEAALE